MSDKNPECAGSTNVGNRILQKVCLDMSAPSDGSLMPKLSEETIKATKEELEKERAIMEKLNAQQNLEEQNDEKISPH